MAVRMVTLSMRTWRVSRYTSGRRAEPHYFGNRFTDVIAHIRTSPRSMREHDTHDQTNLLSDPHSRGGDRVEFPHRPERAGGSLHCGGRVHGGPGQARSGAVSIDVRGMPWT